MNFQKDLVWPLCPLFEEEDITLRPPESIFLEHQMRTVRNAAFLMFLTDGPFFPGLSFLFVCPRVG